MSIDVITFGEPLFLFYANEIAKLEENFQPEILFSFVNQLALEEYQ